MDIVFQTNEGTFNYRVVGVFIENGHVLLHRSTQGEHWALPGGRVALGETSAESLRREFQEELGIDVTVQSLLWMTENFFSYGERPIHEMGLYFKVELQQGTFYREGAFYGEEGDHLIYQWFPLEQLHEMNVLPAFLRNGLCDLPNETAHLIMNDTENERNM